MTKTVRQAFSKIFSRELGMGYGVASLGRAGELSEVIQRGRGRSNENFRRLVEPGWLRGWLVGCLVAVALAGSVLAVPGGAAGVVVSGASSSVPVATIGLYGGGSWNNLFVLEGSSKWFTIDLSRAAGRSVTVGYTVSGTATSGVDFTALSGSVSFSSTQTRAWVLASTIDDSLVESAESVTLTLGSGTGYTLGSQKSTGFVITDNDTAPAPPAPSATIARGDYSVYEGSSSYFTVSLSQASTSAVTVNYTVSGSATSGSDFSALSGSVSIPANSSSARVSLSALADARAESSETVTLTLSSGTGYSVGSPGSATVRIYNARVASITRSHWRVTEGGDQHFTVRLSQTSTSAVRVRYAVSGTATAGSAGAAGADYDTLSGSVTVPANSYSARVELDTFNDSLNEATESVTVTLSSGSHYRLGSSGLSATVWVYDDGDAAPRVTVARGDYSVYEGSSSDFTVRLSAASGRDLTVGYAVSGSAVSGSDYTALGSSVSIPAGQTSATVRLSALADSRAEGTETVILTLSSGSYYTVGSPGAATKRIYNARVVSVSVADWQVDEGENGYFTVRLSQTRASAVTVRYAVSGTATAGSDYQALSGSVTVPANSYSARVWLYTTEDALNEPWESVIVTLVSGGGYRVGSPSSAWQWVDDDDAEPAVRVVRGAASVSEGSSSDFTVRLSAVSGRDLTVRYRVSGSAVSGSDYSALGASVGIPAGQSSVTVRLSALADSLAESAETVTLALRSGSYYTVGSPSAATKQISNAVVASVARSNWYVYEGGDDRYFTVSLSQSSSRAVTVHYNVSGTATAGVAGAAGVDYATLSGSVTIPANSYSVRVPLDTVNDSWDELSPESVTVTLVARSGYQVGLSSAATIWVYDNDAVPSVSVARGSSSVYEGSSSDFTVRLSAVSGRDLSVNYAVSGSATSGSDYAALGASVSIPAGQTSVRVPLSALADSRSEGTETVTLTLSAGSYYTVGSPRAATKRIENGPAPTASVARGSSSVYEGSSSHFTVRLSAAPQFSTTVNYTVSGSATSGVDFAALSGSVTVPAGQTSARVTLSALADSRAESSESVILTLGSGSGYSVGSSGAATVWIYNARVASVSSSVWWVTEGGTDRYFTVSLSQTHTSAVTVRYTVSGTAASGVDFAALSGSVSIPAGSASVRVPLETVDDSWDEHYTETVTVTLTSGSYYRVGSASSSATIWVYDNDPVPSVSVSRGAYSVSEGSSSDFTVRLSAVSGRDLTVNYTVGGTAVSGSDYTALGTSVSIPAGQSSATVRLEALADSLNESSETVSLTLGSGSYYTVGLPRVATKRIANAVVATITRSSASLSEGGRGNFTVWLSQDLDSAVTVRYAVSGSATPGADYTALTGSMTFVSPHSRFTGYNIWLNGTEDDADEPDESVTVTLVAGSGYRVGPASSATLQILDDDTAPSVSVARGSASVYEGASSDFTVRLSAVSGRNLTVGYAVSGSAVSGSDYTALGSSVSIPAGQTSATVTLSALADSRSEGPETVTLTLSAGSHYTVGSPSAATKRIENGPAPSAMIARGAASLKEGQTSDFTVRLLAAPWQDTVVNYTVSGTATSGSDFTALSGSVTVPAGQTSAAVALSALADSVSELDETVTLTLSAGSHYTVGLPRAATKRIVNARVASIERYSYSWPETGSTYFRVRLSEVPGRSVTVSYAVSGTATAGSDFTALSGSVTFSSTQTSRIVRLRNRNDDLDEPDESVTVTLTPGSGYVVGPSSSSTIWIRDDDPEPSAALSYAGGADVPEGQTRTFTVTLSAASGRQLVVPYAAAGGSFLTSGDYRLEPASQVVFEPGQASRAFTLTARHDTASEAPETVTVSLAAPAGGAHYTLGAARSRSLRITSSAPPAATITHTGAAYRGGAATFTVALTPPPVEATQISYAISGTAVAGTDYTAPAARQVTVHPAAVTVLAGQHVSTGAAGAASLAIPVTATATADRTLTVTLAGGATHTAGTPGSATATIKIPLEASLQETTKLEGPAFRVILSEAPAVATTVRYRASGGFVHTGSATFTPAGELFQEVILPVTGSVSGVTVALSAGLPLYRLGTDRSLTLDDYTRPAVELLAMEVTQGTQDWNNSVTLVGDRQTAVRVFFTTTDSREIGVTGRLKGTRVTTYADGSPTSTVLGEVAAEFSRASQITAGDSGGSVVVHAAAAGAGDGTNRGRVARTCESRTAAQQTACQAGIEHVCEANDAAGRSRCRADVDSSLNFVLPLDWAAPPPTGVSGQPLNQILKLELTGLPAWVTVSCHASFTAVSGAACPTGGAPAVEVSFTAVTAPAIVVANIKLANTNGAVSVADTSSCGATVAAVDLACPHLREHYERLLATLPLPTPDRGFAMANVVELNLAFNQAKATVDSSGSLQDNIDDALDKARRDQIGHSGHNAVYAGVIDRAVPRERAAGGGTSYGSAGRAERYEGRYGTAAWYTDKKTGPDDPFNRFGQFMNTGAHEVGHAMGQEHTRLKTNCANWLIPGLFNWVCEQDENIGYCGEQGDQDYNHGVAVKRLGLEQLSSYGANSTPYGFLSAYTGLYDNETDDADNLAPALGPIGDAFTEIWGLDLRYLQNRVTRNAVTRAATGFDPARDQLVVSNPRYVYALMSYCSPEDGFGYHQSRWLDQQYHAQLVTYMDGRS